MVGIPTVICFHVLFFLFLGMGWKPRVCTIPVVPILPLSWIITLPLQTYTIFSRKKQEISTIFHPKYIVFLFINIKINWSEYVFILLEYREIFLLSWFWCVVRSVLLCIQMNKLWNHIRGNWTHIFRQQQCNIDFCRKQLYFIFVFVRQLKCNKNISVLSVKKCVSVIVMYILLFLHYCI